MRKILLTLLILAQLTVMAETKKGNAPVSQPKSAAAAQTAKTEIIGKDGVKRFSTLMATLTRIRFLFISETFPLS